MTARHVRLRPAASDPAETAAMIQDAIDRCAGGSVVLLGEGVFTSGPIRLRDGVELRLAADCLLALSPDKDLYPLVRTDFDGQEAVRCIAPIVADDCADIAITGAGTIDAVASTGGW